MDDKEESSLSNPFQSFDPEGKGEDEHHQSEQTKQRGIKGVPLRVIAPNLVTLMALCAGLSGVRMAIEGRFELALYAILAAALLDGLDGRIARLLKGSSRFGAELDSLTDFVNFGVAPALILHVWLLHEIPSFGWIASLLFAMSMVLRLARFNVALDDKNKPAWKKDFFVGVPAPAGAMLVLLPLYLEQVGVPKYIEMAPAVLAYTLFVAMLVVSSLPTYSGKTIGVRVPRDRVLPLFVGVIACVALFFSYPWVTLSLITLGYLTSIPFARRAWHKANRAMKDPQEDFGSVDFGEDFDDNDNQPRS
ncbi:MAG: phosphatidylcholine/phosphatidylserine synthase [Cohaesibacter sp.]|nr:phosphatidylcholine/phosphatidylserine synthase [Cohaesibacter sp.]MCV6601063.1 phosphatidylcholine/phosphatidylserine synthase [Cohaesibacter sp.]